MIHRHNCAANRQWHGYRAGLQTSRPQGQHQLRVLFHFELILEWAEFRMAAIDEMYVESAAYHESAHIVVAVAQKIPLRSGGVHIDPRGCGIAYYWYRQPDGSTNIGSEVEREKTIISSYAGLIAQQKFYPNCRPAGAWCDTDQATKLLEEMHANRDDFFAAQERLGAESRRLVEKHWDAITALAKALWAKEWSPKPPREKEKPWSPHSLEKRIDGQEIITLLAKFDLNGVIM